MMAESNVVAKLKESFASGTEKRATTKKISGSATTVGVVVAAIGVFLSVVNWLASKSDDGFLNLLIILALAISIYGLKFSTGAAKYYTQIVGIGILVALAMYLVYGSYAPTVLKDWQADFVQSHKDRMAQKKTGTPRGAENVAVEKRKILITWAEDAQLMGTILPGYWSEGYRASDQRCRYLFPDIGSKYDVKVCDNCAVNDLNADGVRVIYMKLREGQMGFTNPFPIEAVCS